MRSRLPRPNRSIEDAIDHALQATLGTLDPRTLTPGDFRALQTRLRTVGLLHHPQLPALLRARRIHAPAVLSAPARPPRLLQATPCPPVRIRRTAG